jgi:alginate O-acetyltransferase complex protein AlgI
MQRRYWLASSLSGSRALGVALNLLLTYFKYLDFFIGSLNRVLGLGEGAGSGLLHIGLPIGVSYIVFEKTSCPVDIARGKAAPAATLREYLLYVLLFPKLLAGPMVKYHVFDPQSRARRIVADERVPANSKLIFGFDDVH